MGHEFWDNAGWAVGVGIILLAVSLRRALPRLIGAWSDRIAARNPVEANPAQAQALEDVQRRLAELEERVDFAERLLAKAPGAERLGKPAS